MFIDPIPVLSSALGIQPFQIINCEKLLADGATIPFIARYRKEATGGLDEVQIENVQKGIQFWTALQKRKETILHNIQEQGKLTPELEQKIKNCLTEIELEDLYLPFKPRRKTKADAAREKGLEGLAKILMAQREPYAESAAQRFLNDEVESEEKALEGARHIIAEWINENSYTRERTRIFFDKTATIHSVIIKGKEADADKYRGYFNFEEPLKKSPAHRVLAMFRAEEEGFLRIKIRPADEEKVVSDMERFYIKPGSTCPDQIKLAVEDSWKRLLHPSLETELRAAAKLKADQESIKVFAENLRNLLMEPPLGPKRILAIDPGFRTGCKVVCLDAQGKLLHNETIYPHPPQQEFAKAMSKIRTLVNQFKIDAIAVGDGTAGRETEFLLKKIQFERKVGAFMVNEDGASVYSASKVGREEFPTYDVTVRGSVSIGRRLMDPLSELIKIDPKSLGIGQYQHDVDQKLLKSSLERVVESCVNAVGVNLNTASKHLLNYVSGLGPKLAENIVAFRDENGPFTSRKDLMKVPGLGPKAFEQSAGFLRVPESANPLDRSAVHPENYSLVQQMAKDLKCSTADLLQNETLIKQIKPEAYITDSLGLMTLNDILKELAKPGRDPRLGIQRFEFDPNIKTIDDLSEGMVLSGMISNVTNFGAFVNIGIKENGLIHISNLRDEFVSNPSEVVSLNQHVKVKVLEVDKERKRIQLSMKGL